MNAAHEEGCTIIGHLWRTRSSSSVIILSNKRLLGRYFHLLNVLRTKNSLVGIRIELVTLLDTISSPIRRRLHHGTGRALSLSLPPSYLPPLHEEVSRSFRGRRWWSRRWCPAMSQLKTSGKPNWRISSTNPLKTKLKSLFPVHSCKNHSWWLNDGNPYLKWR